MLKRVPELLERVTAMSPILGVRLGIPRHSISGSYFFPDSISCSESHAEQATSLLPCNDAAAINSIFSRA
jgi:hypothetical protein